MSTPRVEQIERHGRGTSAPADDVPASEAPGALGWREVEELMRGGGATCWLSVATHDGVHTRPLFAAWTGETLVISSNPGAAKSRHLDVTQAQVSVAMAFDGAHLVVEGAVARVTDDDGLARASRAMEEVYDWPTTVLDDRLDAPYAAPTSGGPPFNVYEVTPTRAFAFPTDDGFEPTRFSW